MKAIVILTAVFLFMGQAYSQSEQAKTTQKQNTSARKDSYTFDLSDKVIRKKVTFKNRFGITVAADLYLPKNLESKILPALAISGPFGAVKEQSSGLYA